MINHARCVKLQLTHRFLVFLLLNLSPLEMNRRPLLLFLALGALLFTSRPVFGQGYRGRDFWVAFPKNAVIEGNKILSLSLLITSEFRTQGSIVDSRDGSNQNFSVESGAYIEEEIDTTIELVPGGDISKNSLHITSDHDISVFVVSHRPASTDSYMAIPADLLGTSYMVAGYTEISNLHFSFFPTQAAAVATEDSTLLTIHLNGPTNTGFPKGRTIEVPLDRGEVFQIEGSDIDSSDLTGTTVSSNKPIAFVTGHQCAQVPANVSFCDVLLEMEPPMEDWGREFVLTKLEDKTYYVARVIAGSDRTDVSIDGKHVATLSSGEFFEDDSLMHDAIVTTSKPALVAQYCPSANFDSLKTGDPFMLFAVPSDRFVMEASSVTPVGNSFRHYLNIVLRDTSTRSLTIDGMSAATGRYPFGVTLVSKRTIPHSEEMVLTLQVPTGRHIVQSTAPFALYAYGFGLHNPIQNTGYDSYGHACGMRLGP